MCVCVGLWDCALALGVLGQLRDVGMLVVSLKTRLVGFGGEDASAECHGH